MRNSVMIPASDTHPVRMSQFKHGKMKPYKSGKDLRHTMITNLDDPDNPSNQRIALKGISFDDLTLADWEAARLGQIEAPFTFEDWEVIDA